ncbi:MAG: cyclic nucleotide-binding/CBS domain-containing protein [Halanaeroarchaeum sp.]
MATEDSVRVEDVMSTPLETIAPDASVTEAAQRMRDLDISGLVVTSADHGIITSTDVIEAVADGRDLSELTVEDVMTESVETVTPDLYMEEVAAMLTTYGIKHLPVVDDDFVGMISSTDVAAHLND